MLVLASIYIPDVTVDVPGYGNITVDISYGGAFYAFVDAKYLGLDINKSSVADLANAAEKVTGEQKKQMLLLGMFRVQVYGGESHIQIS